MPETPMEKCCECLVNIFHQYSVRVDHFDMLSYGELKKMFQEQLPNYMKKLKDPKVIERIFQELDKDRSKQITFGEFMPFVVKMLVAVHDHIHEHEGQGQGQGQGHGHGHSHDDGHGHSH